MTKTELAFILGRSFEAAFLASSKTERETLHNFIRDFIGQMDEATGEELLSVLKEKHPSIMQDFLTLYKKWKAESEANNS